MKKLLMSLFCLLGITGRSSDVLLSANAYTQEYASQLRKALPGSKVTVTKDLELKVSDSKGHEFTAFLNNSYTAYRNSPEDKESIIAKYVRASAEPLHSSKIDSSRITPVIKDRTWLTEIQQEMKARGAKEIPENVYDSLNDELVIVYAEDSPKNLRYLTPKDVETLGVPRESLRELAVKNLRALLPKVSAQGNNGIFMLTAGGDYEASLLLFDKIWNDNAFKVDGDYVVAVPARDLLLITGSKDKAGLAKVRELARKTVAESPYYITADLFVYRNGHFSKFVD